MKKILVLGGGGFIGSNIVRHLLDRGDCYVTAADLSFPRGWEDIYSERIKNRCFKAVAGDFTSGLAFEKLGGGFDEVYMMAAIVGVNRTLEEPHEVIRVNTLLTMNTLDWIKANPVRRLLFASSSETYAGTFDSFGGQIPTPETVPLLLMQSQKCMERLHFFIPRKHLVLNVLLFVIKISLVQTWGFAMQYLTLYRGFRTILHRPSRYTVASRQGHFVT